MSNVSSLDEEHPQPKTGTGVNWNLEYSTATLIQQWQEYLKSKHTVNIMDPFELNRLGIFSQKRRLEDGKVKDIILAEQDPKILVRFFEETDGRIFINQEDGAMDLFCEPVVYPMDAGVSYVEFIMDQVKR